MPNPAKTRALEIIPTLLWAIRSPRETHQTYLGGHSQLHVTLVGSFALSVPLKPSAINPIETRLSPVV